MKLASIFTNGAVVQRDVFIPVWGKCTPGAEVFATLASAVGHSFANQDGEFMLRLSPLPAGGPYELKVTAGREEVILSDIMVGEVWLASGQSNMVYCLNSDWTADPPVTLEERIGRLNYQQMQEFLDGITDECALRGFTVPAVISGVAETNVCAEWKRMDRQNAENFSAAALWYGHFLHKELGVTIGLINSSWGGTKVEAWTSRAGLLSNPDTEAMVHELDILKAGNEFWTKGMQEKKHQEFLAEHARLDTGNQGVKKGWAATEFDDSSWVDMEVPGSWISKQIAGNGAVWFRKKVAIPAAWLGKNLRLNLGGVDKHDISYFNGVEVGRTGTGLEECYWGTPRHYEVPSELVDSTEVVIAVRAFSFAMDGSLNGKEYMYNLECPELDESVDISGIWRLGVEYDVGLIDPGTAGKFLVGMDCPNSPGILFDGMIRPLIPYAIRGAIWYQGESNANLGVDEAARYRSKIGAMICDWRTQWAQGNFPFLQVLLAGYDFGKEASWAVLREGQMQICGDLPEIYTANLIDCGEAMDIHPQDKKSVGDRLARVALTQVYRINSKEAYGPQAAEFVREGKQIRVEFTHADGLYFKDNAAKGFEIAGPDGRFVPAEKVTIDGSSVVISSEAVSDPCAVRYAWKDYPECSLYNSSDLPANPFRS